MTVIEGTQICIPPTGGPRSTAIIRAMEQLLDTRFTGRVGRRAFLTKWAKLRKALFLTPEYQAFRTLVLMRCDYVCESCGDAEAVHVHHIERVAMQPGLALVPANVKGVCIKCHTTIHSPHPRSTNTTTPTPSTTRSTHPTASPELLSTPPTR